jgi:hypothetical protein
MAYNMQPTFRFFRHMQYDDNDIPISNIEDTLRSDSRFYRPPCALSEQKKRARIFRWIQKHGEPSRGHW